MSPVGCWLADSFIPQSLIQQCLLCLSSLLDMEIAVAGKSCPVSVSMGCSLEHCCPVERSVMVNGLSLHCSI